MCIYSLSTRLATLAAAALAVAGLVAGGCSDDSTSPRGGRTWLVPGEIATITAAADTAEAGDVIEIASGTYQETGILLKSGVTMRSAAAAAESVVIDGALQDRILTCQAGDGTTVLSGLTFTRGDMAACAGGAVWASGTSIEVRNCIFTGNAASAGDCGGGAGGGAMVLSHGHRILVTNCLFTGNVVRGPAAVGTGGAIAISGGREPATISNCTFAGNSCPFDGGAVSAARPVVVLNCVFAGNTATVGSGGGLYATGDGLTTVENCLFSDNEAHPYGGGLLAGATSMTIRNCVFSGNQANQGGAICGYGETGTHNGYGETEIRNCQILANSVIGPGGGLCFFGMAAATVVDCLITANSATAGGGAVASIERSTALLRRCQLSQSTCDDKGGGLHVTGDAHVTLEQCQIVQNQVEGYGGGIWIGNSLSASIPEVTLNGCTVSGNEAGLQGGGFFMGTGGGQLTATDSDLTGNEAPAWATGVIGEASAALLTCCNVDTLQIRRLGTLTIDDGDCD